MAGKTGRLVAVALLLGAASSHAAAEGIYSCVDGKGRRLTADRPISECIDREQRELNPSGTVKRRIAPTPTAQERAQQEERSRREQEEKARLAEERKRNQALVTRYPDKTAHDKERLAALAVADDVMAAAGKRTAVLEGERRKLEAELEFYRKDPSKVPARLKRQLEENQQQLAEQQRFAASQEGEKRRINARFDEELARL
ncbi:DUF4124 domain-containing protein, partial [Ramlibacter sp.]|uniref:DUF4124 domain-containing protein n=1 Tax=Ramlibacter sp. TaxID=1917967 RepID=UPI002C24C8E7